MILKYRNAVGRWGWVSGVLEMSELGNDENNINPRAYGCDDIIVLGDEDRHQPYCVLTELANRGNAIYCIYTDELYLTDDETGSTIEILVTPKK